jgi:hypothetical protein
MKREENTNFGECGSPCPTVRLCHKILDFGNAVFHLRKEVALANVLDHVLVDLIRVIIATEFLQHVSKRIAHHSTFDLTAKT